MYYALRSKRGSFDWFIAAERGYIDDVIMPHSTRRRIARALAMLRDKHVEIPAKKHDNLPL
jgi:propionyl-CoA carboxylase beta chain